MHACCVVMVVARLLLLLRDPHLCVRCVCLRPCCGVRFSVVLPSQLLVCADHSMNLMFVCFNFRTVFEYSMLLERDTDLLSRRFFPPLLRSYSFGIQETYICDFSKIGPNLCRACISLRSLVRSLARHSIEHPSLEPLVLSDTVSMLPLSLSAPSPSPSTVTSLGAPFSFNSGCSTGVICHHPVKHQETCSASPIPCMTVQQLSTSLCFAPCFPL
jgi:hypothetical protein